MHIKDYVDAISHLRPVTVTVYMFFENSNNKSHHLAICIILNAQNKETMKKSWPSGHGQLYV
ncbi:hypothetical protein DERF_008229 [Dermatophagoides farinae]|uniref:Uncharacterized protein n=1 Tax=Dermatophagoides farinae TaxID=6954 RepID=A0A922I1Z2_DERFA|nr:hypothetical protein DERF_008229 [Dermatophagoides farinae]